MLPANHHDGLVPVALGAAVARARVEVPRGELRGVAPAVVPPVHARTLDRQRRPGGRSIGRRVVRRVARLAFLRRRPFSRPFFSFFGNALRLLARSVQRRRVRRDATSVRSNTDLAHCNMRRSPCSTSSPAYHDRKTARTRCPSSLRARGKPSLVRAGCCTRRRRGARRRPTRCARPRSRARQVPQRALVVALELADAGELPLRRVGRDLVLRVRGVPAARRTARTPRNLGQDVAEPLTFDGVAKRAHSRGSSPAAFGRAGSWRCPPTARCTPGCGSRTDP